METAEDLDRRVEEARASLLARMEELGRRVHDVREKLDVRARIASHPAAAVGLAVGLGALFGLIRGRAPTPAIESAEARRTLIGTTVAAIGSLAFTVARNLAVHHLTHSARAWWDER